MGYQHARAQVYQINYHLIWCPKRPRVVRVGKVKNRLEQIIRETAKKMHVEVLDLVVNRGCESQQTKRAGSSLQLAEGAFDVRLRPRVVGLGEDGFGWAVLY
jgi:4-hydroxy-3-methylbut-2-en-1-yl diphosphate synthase IspG/GcpE